MNPILQVPCGLAQPEITGGWRLFLAVNLVQCCCSALKGALQSSVAGVGSENVGSSLVLLAIPCFPADRGMPALQSLVFP